MKDSRKIWIGIDPGGKNNFGIAILKSNGTCHTCTVDHVDEACEVIQTHVECMPAGVGIDAPLWWCSGQGGLRQADRWIREKCKLPPKNVQAVNSLWGSVLAQGMMFTSRIREIYPNVDITETHPKAVLVALGIQKWQRFFEEIPTKLTLESQPDHQRDALISAIAAREGFEGRWQKDLIDVRYPTEQDPLKHWLSPVHYFWPS
jgi:predicted nuclease with RNAse H fold